MDEKELRTTGQLRDHRDCSTLTELTLDRLPSDKSVGQSRSIAKGDYVWTAQTTTHTLFFLQRGQVLIMLSDEAGCEVIIRVVKPGETFGELCFCSARGQPRNNCARASVDSVAMEVGFEDFTAFLQRDSDALREFTFTFCKRLSDAEGRVEILSHRGAEARLGRLLLQLAGGSGSASATRPGSVRLSLGHDDLARMAAMTRPHVSVTMGKLRDRGLVHYGRGSQLTVDVPRMAEYIAQRGSQGNV